MTKRFYPLMLMCSVLLLAGCYHTRVETGLTPSAQQIDKPFVSSWVYGLVPTSTVKTAEECPNGVAVVETEASLVNQLVWWLTGGIYTPMHIKVTCASSSRLGDAHMPKEDHLHIDSKASDDEVLRAFSMAADRAVDSRQPVYVEFE